jgi:hypothetical protein
MQIEFTEGPGVPCAPADVRFVAVKVEPYPDRQRLKLSYEVSPFLERPSVEIRLLDPQGADLGSITIIDIVVPRFSLTAHLRSEVPQAIPVRVVSILGYDSLPEVDRHEIVVDLPADGSPPPP